MVRVLVLSKLNPIRLMYTPRIMHIPQLDSTMIVQINLVERIANCLISALAACS
jgi:hypothetical protein